MTIVVVDAAELQAMIYEQTRLAVAQAVRQIFEAFEDRLPIAPDRPQSPPRGQSRAGR